MDLACPGERVGDVTAARTVGGERYEVREPDLVVGPTEISLVAVWGEVVEDVQLVSGLVGSRREVVVSC